ncbi:MAG: aminotransferase class III-fold pyridoxal phosphate-dependent enzyme, partial [Bacteroidetes bacterium]|nr:aminotransferase class III-fold pyridoxal phosphate-dependent enzyme [Bacteroidota bacterium]
LNELQKLFPDQILEVRGRGFMLGLLLNFEASNLVQDMLKNCNVITNATSGNVLRIVPPLIIDLEEIDLFVESLKSCLSKQK